VCAGLLESNEPRSASPRGPATVQPLVCAVVVNYRQAALTLRCVERLRRSRYERLHIVVVDNGSADGSATRLRTELPALPPAHSPNANAAGQHPGCNPAVSIELVEQAHNLGFAAGANAGIRRALGLGAAMVWLLTPDVLVEPHTLPQMVRAMGGDPQLGICGPVICAGSRAIIGCRLWPRLGYYARLQTVCSRDLSGLPARLPTDYVDGGCMLLRARMLREIGTLSEDFFLYYEDAELGLRARRAGWKLALMGTARAYTRPLEEPRNDRTFYMARSSLRLARREKRYLLRTAVRHLLQAAWQAWRHLNPLDRGTKARQHGISPPDHVRAAEVLRATWRGLRSALRGT